MTDTITEARELLETDALVTAAEYKRVIKGLISQVYQAYEDGATQQVLGNFGQFSYDDLLLARSP